MSWFVFALVGAFSNAIFNYTIKRIMEDIDPFILLAWTYLFGGFFLSLILFSHGIPDIGPSFISTLFIIIVMGIVSLTLYFYSIKITDLSLCIPMLSFTPVFLIFTSPLLLAESPSIMGIVGICCIVIGAYLISYSGKNNYLPPFYEIGKNKGVILMLIVAFLFAVGVNFDKMLVMQSDPLFSATAEFLAFGFVFIIISGIKFRTINLIQRKNVIPFLFTGLILTIEALSINYAYTLAIVPYVISVKRISILFSVILGGILLNEKDLKRRLVASSMMVFGAVIIAFS